MVMVMVKWCFINLWIIEDLILFITVFLDKVLGILLTQLLSLFCHLYSKKEGHKSANSIINSRDE